MEKNDTTHDGRTESKRFADDVSGDDLIEGDRIDPAIVARDQARIGDICDADAQYPKAQREQEREYQLAEVTATNRYDDVHSALLVDPETETLIRAGRIDRQQAMTQAEADWTVREVGSKVVVDEVHELDRPEQEQDEPAEEYVKTWTDVLFGDIVAGYDDYEDERKLDSSTLMLNDYDGRKAIVSISLED